MARREERSMAIKLRLKGFSYSQIKSEIGLSKSTLSGWLSNYPLSTERIKELRDNNPRRIENFRTTMQRKREERWKKVFEKVSKDVGKLNKRELFIAGLFLYWGEGGKTLGSTTALTNTNPSMLKFYIKWLKCLGVKKEKLRVSLHLYSDMNVEKEVGYWSKKLGLNKSQFRKPCVKPSKLARITYKSGFGHGTCSVVYDNRDINEYVLLGIKYLTSL